MMSLSCVASVNNMRRDFLQIQRAEKLRTVGTFHDLRESCDTLLARQVPMHELQKLLGHASITTTAEYYSEANQDVTAAVGRVFSVEFSRPIGRPTDFDRGGTSPRTASLIP